MMEMNEEIMEVAIRLRKKFRWKLPYFVPIQPREGAAGCGCRRSGMPRCTAGRRSTAVHGSHDRVRRTEPTPTAFTSPVLKIAARR